MRIAFRKILWVKSVSMDEGVLAYSPEDRGSKARLPRRGGDRFELHAAPEDAESLGDPEIGDVVVLTQHEQATHLVRVVGEGVEPRPRRTIRRHTRDERFTVQRTVELLILRPFDEAPFVEEAFGFDPRATGGETFRIGELEAFRASVMPLWAVQRRIERAMMGLLPDRAARRVEPPPVPR